MEKPDFLNCSMHWTPFYFLICGALVMWMAAGFAMLEAGLVRSKNTTEILTKNVALFAVACTMYLICGYQIMYGGGYFLSGITTVAQMARRRGHRRRAGGVGRSGIRWRRGLFKRQRFLLPGGVRRHRDVDRFRRSGRAHEAMGLPGLRCGHDRHHLPIRGELDWGSNSVFGLYSLNYSDYAGSGIVHLAGATAALAGVILLGPRKGKYGRRGETRAIPGANLPLATLGTFILWMGWFGFNAARL